MASTLGPTSLAQNSSTVRPMARCSEVRSSGVKISLGVRSSMRKAPPFVLGNTTVAVAIQVLLLHSFKNTSGALAAAYAHGDQTVFRIAARHFQQDGGGEFGSRAPERMAQGDGASIDVDYFRIDAGLLDDGQGLHAEGLVQFDDADIAESEAGHFEGFGNGYNRADAHDFRRDAAGGEADEAGHGLKTQFAGFALGHDQGGGGAIAGLGRVAGRDRAARVEHGFEPGERLKGGVRAGAFVFSEDGFDSLRALAVRADPLEFKGHDFVIELAFGLGAQGVLVTAEGEGVGSLAGDVVFALHALGGETHVHVDFGPVIDEPGAGGGFVAAARDEAHGFGAAGDDDLGAPGAYAFGSHGDSLQTGTAEAVDGDTGDSVGQACAQGHAARHVIAGLGFGHGAAEDYVFDFVLRYLGILD